MMKRILPVLTLIASTMLTACASPGMVESDPVAGGYKPNGSALSLPEISAESCTGLTRETAVDLTPGEPVAHFDRITTIDPYSACFVDADGEPAGFTVFALPTEPRPVSVLAGGAFARQHILTARVEVRDADFQPIRTIDPAAFRDRGVGFVAAFRTRPGDAYVVITPDRSRIGQQVARFVADPANPDGMAPSGTLFTEQGRALVRIYFEAPE